MCIRDRGHTCPLGFVQSILEEAWDSPHASKDRSHSPHPYSPNYSPLATLMSILQYRRTPTHCRPHLSMPTLTHHSTNLLHSTQPSYRTFWFLSFLNQHLPVSPTYRSPQQHLNHLLITSESIALIKRPLATRKIKIKKNKNSKNVGYCSTKYNFRWTKYLQSLNLSKITCCRLEIQLKLNSWCLFYNQLSAVKFLLEIIVSRITGHPLSMCKITRHKIQR